MSALEAGAHVSTSENENDRLNLTSFDPLQDRHENQIQIAIYRYKSESTFFSKQIQQLRLTKALSAEFLFSSPLTAIKG